MAGFTIAFLQAHGPGTGVNLVVTVGFGTSCGLTMIGSQVFPELELELHKLSPGSSPQDRS